MARRRYKRAAKALTQLSRGKQETKFAQIKAQNIRAGTEAALESMNKKFEMAGQALVTADALAQEYKTKGKVEKGVTSLAEAKGGDVSYKKTGLGDIFRGEGKLSEWGKETWTIGEDKAQYDRADILAWEEKGRKDLKWEGIIGKEMTSIDKEGTVTTGRKKVEPSKPKDYTIEGETALFDKVGMDYDKKYGKGWSYKKQKAINKLSDVDKQFGAGGGEGILRGQVAANVGSSNYDTISKAFKSEYSRDQNLMKGIKTLDLKHKAAMHHKGNVDKRGKDDIKGVVMSSTAVQKDIKFESPLIEFGIKKSDTSAKDKEHRRRQSLTDSEIVAEAKLMHKKDMAAYTMSKPKTPSLPSGELSPEMEGDIPFEMPAQQSYTPLDPLAEYNPVDKNIEYSETGRPTHTGKKSKDYWGERKGIDVWEKFKEGAASRSEARTTKRTERKEAKAKAAITKLTSGDDFVSAGELEELEAGSKIEEADLSFDDDTRLSLGENPHDKDKPALTSTFDSKSGDIPFYTDASGKSYTESDVTGGQDFTKTNYLTNTRSNHLQIAIQRETEAKMDYTGSVEQNIGVLENMMGSGLSDLTGEGSMYEDMGIAEIWNTGPLGEQYGKWNTKDAKRKRKSMWAQIQETNYGASYGK